MLRIDRRLHVVADRGAASLPQLHRTALRIREGALCLAAGRSLCLKTCIEKLALRERLNLRLSLGRAYTAGRPRIVLVVLTGKFLERGFDTLVDLR